MSEGDSSLFENLISSQPFKVSEAIRVLQSRGLMFCGHFGYENAIDRLADMNQAFAEGRLYEWLKDVCGVRTP